MDYIKKRCLLCHKVKASKSFHKGNADICNSCHFLLYKAIKMNVINVNVKMRFREEQMIK